MIQSGKFLKNEISMKTGFDEVSSLASIGGKQDWQSGMKIAFRIK